MLKLRLEDNRNNQIPAHTKFSVRTRKEKGFDDAPLKDEKLDKEKIEQISGDGAFDRKIVYQALERRRIKRVAIPPRRGARIWKHGNSSGERLVRDENLRYIRGPGKAKWKRESGYTRRSIAETGVFRFKTIFSDKLQSRRIDNQFQEMFIKCAALNRMTHLGMPDCYKITA